MSDQKYVWNPIEPSLSSMKAGNPIRMIMDRASRLDLTTDKKLITLVAGDPARYDNLSQPLSVHQSLKSLYANKNICRYPRHTFGFMSARKAVLSKYSASIPNIDIKDISICGGCTQALSLSMCSLLNINDNILMPRPGWAAYSSICIKNSFKYKYYNLLPDEWQIDCDHLETLIDDKTKAILINNPSNPCGSILTEENLLNLLKIANKYRIPIISDEVYDKLIYPNYDDYISLSSLKNNPKYIQYKDVPILVCSGTAKSYLIPGWKLGWLIIDDQSTNKYVSKNIRVAIQKLQSIYIGPSTITQSMLSNILLNTPDSYWNGLNRTLYKQSSLFCEYIRNNIPQLSAVQAKGTLYVFIKIKIDKLYDIKDDVDFFEKLLSEQALMVVPGSVFQMKNYFRIVICAAPNVLLDAAKRLKQFCAKHGVKQSKL